MALYLHNVDNSLRNIIKKYAEVKPINLDKLSGGELFSAFASTYMEYGADQEVVISSCRVLLLQSFLEGQHNKRGRHYIQIPHDAVNIIKDIKIDKVDPDSVRIPFGVTAWDLPNGVYSGSKKCSILTCSNKFNDVDYHFMQHGINIRDMLLIEGVGKGVICAGFAENQKNKIHLQDILFMSNINLQESIESNTNMSIRDYVDSKYGTYDGPVSCSYNEQNFDDALKFIYKACIFIQAHPESLEEGPILEHIINTKRRKKKEPNIKAGPSFVFKVPEMYKTKGAHYVRPHFRSLSHERYRREDENGNLLEVGEAGFVRIQAIKGFFKGGRISHLNTKQTTT